jgi:hypothetical protein
MEKIQNGENTKWRGKYKMQKIQNGEENTKRRGNYKIKRKIQNREKNITKSY